jgi:integrase
VHAYTRYRGAQGRPIQLVALTRHVRWLSLFFRIGLGVLSHTLTMADFGLPMGRGGSTPRAWRRTMLDDTDGASLASSSGRFSLSTLAHSANEPNNMREFIRRSSTNLERIHYFRAYEIRALYLACDTLFERILLTCLFTTGMRIGGFCTLTMGNLSTGEINGVEKGNVVTAYCVTDVLAQLLREWNGRLADDPTISKRYLFPGRDGGPDSHIAPSTVRRVFQRVAQRAGLTGSHVHPHTTRHTVAWTLHALGNSVENVAGFVGHRSPQVTSQVYIALTRAQQRALVDCPWLNASRSRETRQSMRHEAMEMALAICSPFGSVDGRTFPIQAPGYGTAKAKNPCVMKSLGRLAAAYLAQQDSVDTPSAHT